MQLDPFATLAEIRRRSTEAVLGQSGLNHAGLAAEIRARLDSTDPNEGGLLAEPVLEAAPRYVEADRTMAQLASDGLLSAELVDGLDGAGEPPLVGERERYRFGRDWSPYQHQLQAWEALLQSEPRSVLVSSGTGSGKTECFLIPILESLLREPAAAAEPGVRAVVLYPLNALIASQRERLSDWTRPFHGRIRFGLYNGLTPHRVEERERRLTPEQAVDRDTLRRAPPSILVTNVTMLEYMLLRREDAPILQQSRGKLRYVVLDEAHSYIGAQAAEIALLLRRVCLAFDVRPQDVRFVATSATIGGPDAEAALRSFLADVSGAEPDQCLVVTGRPRWAALPDAGAAPGLSCDALDAMDAHEAGRALAGHAHIQPLLHKLRAEPVSWSALQATARAAGAQGTSLAMALSRARLGEEPLSPLRVHGFHRAVGGLWSCLNPDCGGSRPADWPFGALAWEDKALCRFCAAPTFQVLHCHECGEPWLETLEAVGTGRLQRPVQRPPGDDYGEEIEPVEDEDGDSDGPEPEPAGSGYGRLIAVRALASKSGEPLRPLFVSRSEWRVCDGPEPDTIQLFGIENPDGAASCAACGKAHQPHKPAVMRPIRFGAPFLLPNATPVLLEGVSPMPVGPREPTPPLGGRQLLSFTDSRQGTARIAAKLQTGSERNAVRSAVYHLIQQSAAATPDTSAVDAEIAQLQTAVATVPALQSMLDGKVADRAKLLAGSAGGIAWLELEDRLSSRTEIDAWLRPLWKSRDNRYESATAFARFLLLREFLRRPRRANTLETLGLARLHFARIDDLPDARTPPTFTALGGSGKDWRDFLFTIVTFVFRGYSAVDASRDDQHWIQPKTYLKWVIKGAEEQASSTRIRFPWIPQRSAPLGRPSRPVVLLKQAFGLDLDDPQTRASVAEVLDAAWLQLAPVLTTEGTSAQLDLKRSHIAPVEEAWFCPRTRRVLDVAFRGLSPYGADLLSTEPVRAEPIHFPRHPSPFPSEERRGHLLEWLRSDPRITALRDRGAWSDISDRVALSSRYFRAAEHSAQQPAERLRHYEQQFRRGEINVLNCSTTMEMGVDIGSVQTVLMTNTPPSLANYRQRVGRAGRRGQSISTALTLCKDLPLDRAAFADPVKYLTRQVRAPKVALQSETVVQRHVNALLFAAFMRGASGNALGLEAGPFFGCPAAPGAVEDADSPAAQFVRFADAPDTVAAWGDAVARLTARSALEARPEVFGAAASAMEQARAGFSSEWSALQALLKTEARPEAAKGLELQLWRLCREYLLRVLSDRGVLPGHGFPTGVVSFRCRMDDDAAVRGASRKQPNPFPQRALDVALREYAPGAEVMLDGLVHRSAGVTLNWKRPVSEESVTAEVQALWWRWRCPTCLERGSERIRPEDGHCPSCDADAQWTRYLEPAGFAADFGERPHADADDVSQASADPAVVSAPPAPWLSLFDPRLGRMRSGPGGRVYVCNPGPFRQGFKLCLECGRAEPETEANAAGGWDHAPLAGRRARGETCAGATRPFAVRRNLRLGREIGTDVFELQATGLTRRGTALAFANALREALARSLGVEADEMGAAADVRQGPFGRTQSVFLFDRASGGAGFASQAAEQFDTLLQGVREVLDCRVAGCVTGCPACVLTRDLSAEDARDIDRIGALAFCDMLLIDAEPEEADRAAPNARLCRSIVNALDAASRQGASLTVRLQGGLEPEGLAIWPLRRLVRTWTDRGAAVTIAVEEGAVIRLDGANALAVRDWLSDLGAGLAEAPVETFANGAATLADATFDDQPRLVFATRDGATRAAGAGWGAPSEFPIVRFTTNEAAPSLRPVPKARLAPPPGAAVPPVGKRLDGDLAGFGVRMAKLIRGALVEVGAGGARVVEASYADRYLNSPLTARLCLDTLAGLAMGPATVRLWTRPLAEALDRRGPPRLIQHDWREEDDRCAVLTGIGRQRQLHVNLRIGAAPHARRLDLVLENATRATIYLDQGFGAWATIRDTEFDFRQSVAGQVRQLMGRNTLIAVRGDTYFVVRSASA